MNRLATASLLLSFGALGCSALLDPGESQCDSAADCEARGFAGASCVEQVCVAPTAVDPVWGCLGHVVESTPDASKKVALNMSLVLAVDKSPVTKALIDVCDKLDVDCAGKNPDYPKGLSPGKDGSVKLQVPQGFAGFVRISDAAFVDTRVYVGRPLMAQPDFNQVRLLRPGDYSGLAALAGLDVDVKRGTAIFASIDCRGQTASAVRFKSPSADSKSTGFYLINQVPAMPPAASSTDKDGFGGFFNLPPGNAVGRAYRAKDETFIGESSFQVLANTISFVLIGPSPE